MSRPAAPMRTLTCTHCREPVTVLEAAHGARTPTEHEWVDPNGYVCGDCHTPTPPKPIPYGVIPF